MSVSIDTTTKVEQFIESLNLDNKEHALIASTLYCCLSAMKAKVQHQLLKINLEIMDDLLTNTTMNKSNLH